MRTFAAGPAAALVAAAAIALLAPAAPAADYAPVDREGPALGVPAAELDASLACTGDPASAPGEPVLLVHGTALTPRQFAWNWARALDALGRAHCELDLGQEGMGDIQLAAERVVHAIRALHDRAGRRIDVVGHSQGGMVPRWALRFWPDTRALVDDLVGIAASNHGTVDAEGLCTGRCPPAFLQQRRDSRFVAALNSRAETFAGVDYTALYTRLDEVVVPNLDDTGSTSLRGGGANVANVAVQDVCPLDVVEHLGIATYDGPAYAIARDALDQPGPADPARVSRTVCAAPLMPGVEPAGLPARMAELGAGLGTAMARSAQVDAEPPLRCYVFAACATPAAAAATPRLTRRCVRRGLRVRVQGDATAIRAVTFRLGGRREARDTRAPFTRVIGRRALRRAAGRRLHAVITPRAGARRTLSRTLPRC
jgi:hypothetical protein